MTQSATTVGGPARIEVRPGQPSPMGSKLDAGGTNFAVYSSSASEGAVSLCLFADDGTETTLPLTARTGDVWHGYVPGIRAGRRYGYRVAGPWNPQQGLWGNGAKLLLDPWSKAIDGDYDGDSSACAHLPGDRANRATRRRMSLGRWWSTRASTGAPTRRRASRWPTRSSTKLMYGA